MALFLSVRHDDNVNCRDGIFFVRMAMGVDGENPQQQDGMGKFMEWDVDKES